MTKNNFMPLMDDPMIKHILGENRFIDFTKNLVHNITNIPYKKLEGAIITNGEELGKNNIKDKAFSCDIMMRLKNGMKIIIESQNNNDSKSEIKNIFYGLRELLNQIPKGEKIKKLKPVYQIIIVKNDYVKRKIQKKLINEFHLTEKNNNKFVLLNGLYTIKIIDIKSEIGYSEANDELKGWINLFRAKNQIEAEIAVKRIKILEGVLKEMNNFMDENYVRTYKEKYDDEMELLKKIWKKEARKEGREKGRLEGIEQGSNKKSYEIAIKMLEKDMNPKDIEELTGVTYDRIHSLTKNISKKYQIRETKAKYNQK